MQIRSSLNSVGCLLAVSVAGCAHKPPTYQEAMLDARSIFIAQAVLDSYKHRALDFFEYPEGIDLVGYVRSLKPDTNHPVTFGFTKEGGGRVIVHVPAHYTNGPPVLVEFQFDYGSWTSALSRLSFTVQGRK